MKNIFYAWCFLLMLVSQTVFAQAPTISGGNAYTAMLCQNGDVYTWGANNTGQLGRQITSDYTSIPGKVDYFSDNGISITAIAPGGDHMLALDSEGQVWAWGDADEGQIGNGIASLDYGPCSSNSACYSVYEPVAVMAGEANIAAPTDVLTGIKAISASWVASYAITADNKLLAWGGNSMNALGTDGTGWLMSGDLNPLEIGVTSESSLPVFVINANTGAALENVIAVAAGDFFAYALVDDDDDGDPETGRVYAWGESQISNPVICSEASSSEASVARLVIDENGNPISGVNVIEAGGENGYFVKKTTGEVYSVGADELGQRGLGTANLRPDFAAKVVAGELEDTLHSKYLTNVVSITAGQTFASAVINADGAQYTVTWGGNNAYGINGEDFDNIGILSQLDLPYHSYGARTAMPGLVKFQNGNTLKYITQVSASDGNIYAIQNAPGEETKLWCWGDNHFGQVGLGNETNGEDMYMGSIYPEPQEVLLPFCTLATPCPTALIRQTEVFSCHKLTAGVEAVTLATEHYSHQYIYTWIKDGAMVGTEPALLADSAGQYILKVSLSDETLHPGGCPVATDSVTLQAYQPNFTVETEIVETDPAEIVINGTDGDVFDIYASAESAQPLGRDTIAGGTLTFSVELDSLESVTAGLTGMPYPEDEIYKRMYIRDKSEYPVELLTSPNISTQSVGSFDFVSIYQAIEVATSEALFQSIDISIRDYSIPQGSFSVQVVICGETVSNNGVPIVDPTNVLYTSDAATISSIGISTVPVNIVLNGNESAPTRYWVGFNLVDNVNLNAYYTVFEAEADPIIDPNNAGVAFTGCSDAYGNSTQSSTHTMAHNMKFCGFNLQFTTYSDYPCDLTPVDIKLDRSTPVAATPQFIWGGGSMCVQDTSLIKPSGFEVQNNGLLNHNVYYFQGYIDLDSLKSAGDLSGAYAEYPGITDINELDQLRVPYDSAGNYTIVVTDASYSDDTDAWTSETFYFKRYLKPEVLVDPASSEFCEVNTDSVRIELNGTAPFSLAYSYGGTDYQIDTEDTIVSFAIDTVPGEYEFKLLSMSDKNCPAFVTEPAGGTDTLHRTYTVLEEPHLVLASMPAIVAGTAQPVDLSAIAAYNHPYGTEYEYTALTDALVSLNEWDISDPDMEPGLYDFEVAYQYADGCTVRDTFALEVQAAPRYTVTFEIDDFAVAIEDAEVALQAADTLIYLSDENGQVFIKDLHAGQYTYSVVKEGFDIATGSFELTKDTVIAVHFNLMEYDAQVYVKSGTEAVVGAEISLGGKYTTDSYGYAMVSGLHYGEYLVTVHAEGFESYIGYVNITGTSNHVILDDIQLQAVPTEVNISRTDTACGQYDFYGDILKESGEYQHTVTVEGGLDSVITLDLTIGMEYLTTQRAEITAGSSYEFRGQTYDATGIYTEEFTTVLGCDSVFVLDLKVISVDDTLEVNLVESGCGAIDFRGQLVDATGIYRDTVITETADTIFTLDYTLWPRFESILEQEIALGESFEFEGQTYDETGVYSVEYTTVHGCDSILTLDLSVETKPTVTIDSVYAGCGSYTYLDSTYTQSTVIDTLFKYTELADTIIAVSIEIWPVYEQSFDAEIAEGESYTFNGEEYTEAGEYPHLFTTEMGCDSTITLNLSVKVTGPDKDTLRSVFEYSACSMYTTDSIGTYYDTVETDSSIEYIEYRYTYAPIAARVKQINMEYGETYMFRGRELSDAGLYTDTVKAASEDECDTVYSVSIFIDSPGPGKVVVIDSSAAACESFTYAGVEYTESTSLRDTIESPEGDDTVFVFNLTILESYWEERFDTVTVGQYIVIGNDTIGNERDYTEAFVSQQGCDSTILHHVAVNVPESATVITGDTAVSLDVDEDIAAGTVIAYLPYTDDNGTVLGYTLSDTDNFEIENGAIVVKEGASFDYEIAEELPLEILIDNGAGIDTSVVTIAVGNVNDNKPKIAESSENALLVQGTQNGSSVMTVSASDLDGDALTYSIVTVVGDALKEGEAMDVFAIDPATGEISIVDISLVDFTATESYTIKVAATDGKYTDTSSVVVDLQAHIVDSKESAKATAMTVYPTIASETLTVSAPVNGQLSVTTLNGAVAAQGIPFSGTLELSVDGLPAGSYIIRLETGNSVFEEQFFKQ